jgi:hypothetical protein
MNRRVSIVGLFVALAVATWMIGAIAGIRVPALPRFGSVEHVRFDVTVLFDDYGGPVRGVPVWFERGEPTVQPPPELEPDPLPVNRHAPVTDEQGRVEFTLQRGFAWTFVSGWHWEARRTVDAGDASEYGVTIWVEKPWFGPQGRVVDANGAPIRGARIQLLPSMGVPASEQELEMPLRPESVISCAEDGRFKIAQDFRSYSPVIVFNAPGFGPQREWSGGHSPRESPRDVHLERAGTIRFHALDREGRPLIHTTVRCACGAQEDALWNGSFAPGGGLFVWSASLDAEGRATFTDLPTKRTWLVSLWAGDTELARAPGLSELEPGETRDLEWRIGTGTDVEGELRSATGAPWANLEVILYQGMHFWATDPKVAPETSIVARCRSDSMGRFRFEDVRPGQWRIGARCPDERPCACPKASATYRLGEDIDRDRVVIQLE